MISVLYTCTRRELLVFGGRVIAGSTAVAVLASCSASAQQQAEARAQARLIVMTDASSSTDDVRPGVRRAVRDQVAARSKAEVIFLRAGGGPGDTLSKTVMIGCEATERRCRDGHARRVDAAMAAYDESLATPVRVSGSSPFGALYEVFDAQASSVTLREHDELVLFTDGCENSDVYVIDDGTDLSTPAARSHVVAAVAGKGISFSGAPAGTTVTVFLLPTQTAGSSQVRFRQIGALVEALLNPPGTTNPITITPFIPDDTAQGG